MINNQLLSELSLPEVVYFVVGDVTRYLLSDVAMSRCVNESAQDSSTNKMTAHHWHSTEPHCSASHAPIDCVYAYTSRAPEMRCRIRLRSLLRARHCALISLKLFGRHPPSTNNRLPPQQSDCTTRRGCTSGWSRGVWVSGTVAVVPLCRSGHRECSLEWCVRLARTGSRGGIGGSVGRWNIV